MKESAPADFVSTRPARQETVALRPRWRTIGPVVAAVVGVVALIAVFSGSFRAEAESSQISPPSSTPTTTEPPNTEPLTTESLNTESPNTSGPLSEAQQSATTVPVLETQIDVSEVPVDGFVYAVSMHRRLVRIDLSDGSVSRSDGQVLATESIAFVGDRILLGNRVVQILDDQFDQVALIQGQYLASRTTAGRDGVGQQGEVWTAKFSGQAGSITELIRSDLSGQTTMQVPATLDWVAASYQGDSLRVFSSKGSWIIDPNGGIERTDVFGPRSIRSGWAVDSWTRCADTELRCDVGVTYDGERVVLSSAVTRSWSMAPSWSGRFLLATGPTGPNLIDLTDPSVVQADDVDELDRWAVGADLLIKGFGTDLIIVDPLNDESWRTSLPADLFLSANHPVLLVVNAG